MIDLPLPGAPLHPFQRTTEAIRQGYARLPPWAITRRVGELVDALQLPELSLGDAAATYSVAMGGVAGPGSGMLIRVDKLIDWTQHVAGDLNRVAGGTAGRPHGLMTWSLPERVVDRLQWLLLKTVNITMVRAVQLLDQGLSGVEAGAEALVNLGRRRPHQQTTVFLRLSVAVYRVYQPWIAEHPAQLLVGPPELFAASTHGALAHGPRLRTPMARLALPPAEPGGAPVIVMTTVRVLSRAPRPLTAYVVPASRVLQEK
jgi:hypothetical protein